MGVRASIADRLGALVFSREQVRPVGYIEIIVQVGGLDNEKSFDRYG